MRKNSRSHPNNSNIVNVQLDERRAHTFHRMRKAAGLSISEALKAILNPVIDRYELEIMDAERYTAESVMGVHNE